MIAIRPLLVTLTLLFAADASAKTLTIDLDVSASSPVLSKEFAAVAANHARAEITALQPGDWVVVRRFGMRNLKNVPSEKIRITRQRRAGAVAESVARYIAALPSTTSEADNQTNLLALFQFGSYDCSNERHRIVIYTDGIEASATMSDRAFLSGKPLPPPPTTLKSCEVVFFGLGQSKDGDLPPAITESIRQRWTEYFKVAGAKFTAIIDP